RARCLGERRGGGGGSPARRQRRPAGAGRQAERSGGHTAPARPGGAAAEAVGQELRREAVRGARPDAGHPIALCQPESAESAKYRVQQRPAVPVGTVEPVIRRLSWPFVSAPRLSGGASLI